MASNATMRRRRMAVMLSTLPLACVSACSGDSTTDPSTGRLPASTSPATASSSWEDRVPDYPIVVSPDVRVRLNAPPTCGPDPHPAVVAIEGYRLEDQLVEHGYVVVSVERPDDTMVAADFSPEFVHAIQVLARVLGIAVQWLRATATEHCVAPDAIAVAGHSYSAITALALAYSRGTEGTATTIVIDDLGDPVAVPGSPVPTAPDALDGWSPTPNAVIAHAGFALPDAIEPGDPPALLFHGVNDGTVPYALAEQTCEAAAAQGVVCEIVVHSEGHAFSGDDLAATDIVIGFLNRVMLGPAGLEHR